MICPVCKKKLTIQEAYDKCDIEFDKTLCEDHKNGIGEIWKRKVEKSHAKRLSAG